MSKYMHELCCSLIEDYYGELYARIFSHLTHHGRYAASQIAMKCQLPLSQIKVGLATLVQLRLVYHHTSSEGASTYQANATAAYNIIRMGKLIHMARTDYGELAAAILAETILLGFGTMAEIKNQVWATLSQSSKYQNQANGLQDDAEETATESAIQTIMKTLVHTGYLTHMRSAHFQTTFDAGADVEAQSRGSGAAGTVRTRKAQLEHEERVAADVFKAQSTDTPELGFTPVSINGQKRSATELDAGSHKKQKLSNGTAKAVINGGSPRFEANVLVCVSYKNTTAQIRNELLLGTASKCVGSECSHVLRSVLSQIPTSDVYTPTESELWLDLPQLRKDLGSGHAAKLRINGSNTNGMHFQDTDDGARAGSELYSYDELQRHLGTLSESIFNCLEGGYSHNSWKVNTRQLISSVQEAEILRIISDRLGPPALRIIRMLMKLGRLDEKILQETGLLGAKDLRQTLAELSQMGFIDLQEVPREAQRQPNRTIFLWFFDAERVRKGLLETMYKAMLRLAQRLRIERAELSATLEKVERSDVRGVEEQMLSPAELKIWKRWQRKEAWMLGEISRLDGSVAILRDL